MDLKRERRVKFEGWKRECSGGGGVCREVEGVGGKEFRGLREEIGLRLRLRKHFGNMKRIYIGWKYTEGKTRESE